MSKKFNVRLFDELESIYPDTDVNSGKEIIRVAGANGTIAGVHILLSGLTPGLPVTIEVHGESNSYKMFEILPIPVEVNTGAKIRTEYMKNDVNEHVIRRAPFLVYDVYKPIFNIVMPTLTTMALAFKYLIEYCQKPHTKTWNILVTHDGVTKKLTFFVDEHPVSVEKAGPDTHKYINWLSYDNIASFHQAPKWSAKYEMMVEKYFRVALYSRQNMVNIPPQEYFEIGEDGKPQLNEQKLDTLMRIAKKVGICWFNGDAIAVRAAGFADNDEFYRSMEKADIKHPDEIAEKFKEMAFDAFDNGTKAMISLTGELIPGAGEETLKSMTAQLYSYLKKNGLTKNWYQSCLDEPNDALADTYRILSDITRDTMPGVKILEPVLETEKIAGMIDVLCPSADIYEKEHDFYQKEVEDGAELFVYTCLTPGGNYCNRLLDMEHLRQVWLGWAPAKYDDIGGFLHWGGNMHCSPDPYSRQATMFSENVLEFHPKKSMFLPAGDATIYFPGNDEPLISVRSESHRIGYEDLCLLEMLKASNPQATSKLVEEVFRSYSDYEKDICVYRNVKEKLLSAVDTLSK